MLLSAWGLGPGVLAAGRAWGLGVLLLLPMTRSLASSLMGCVVLCTSNLAGAAGRLCRPRDPRLPAFLPQIRFAYFSWILSALGFFLNWLIFLML